jgi:hypothetical protein
MAQTPTAKELFDKMLSLNEETTSTEMMIEFAKLHVEAALKAASEGADYYTDGQEHIEQVWIDKDSILNSYPLENIK